MFLNVEPLIHPFVSPPICFPTEQLRLFTRATKSPLTLQHSPYPLTHPYPGKAMGSLSEVVRQETKKWRLGNIKTHVDVIKGTIFTYHGDEVTTLALPLYIYPLVSNEVITLCNDYSV